MGKRLYCIITGSGIEGIKINNTLSFSTEEEAWKSAFARRGVKVQGQEWQNIYNNWNKGDWGQLDSKVGLKDCIIWIKKKEKFTIDKSVEDSHAKKIVNDIQTKLKSLKDIDEIIILVHVMNDINENIKKTYRKTNKNIPIEWHNYSTAHGGIGMIDLVKKVIKAIYFCNLNNLRMSRELPKAKKKAEIPKK